MICRVAERQRDAHPVGGGDGQHGDGVGIVPVAEGAQLDAAPDHARHQPPPGGVVTQRVGPHLGVADPEVPGLDPQPPGVRLLRLVSGQRPDQDPLELLPRVADAGDLGLQLGDLRARRVPERRHQQVLAGAEVVLQGADRDAAFGRHVGEAGGVGAPVRDDPAGGLEHRDLPAPGPAAGPAAPPVGRGRYRGLEVR